MVKLAFPIREGRLDYTVNDINRKSWPFKKKKGRFGSLFDSKSTENKKERGERGKGRRK